jgi:peptidoglycan hydrolase CwlO-like protein
MAQKTAIPGIYKVSEGILINKDNDALKAYKARKNKDRQIEQVQEELYEVKKDINEIKSLLLEILGKK